MENFMEPWVLWTVIGLALLLMEFIIPGLIVFFFGLGALLVGLLSLVTDLSLNAQLLIFLVGSVVFLLSLRKWVAGVFYGTSVGGAPEDRSDQEFVGDLGVVVSAIDPAKGGKIELHGSHWNAESDEAIAEGERVEVVGRASLIVKVKKV